MSANQLVKGGFTVLMAVYQNDNVGLFEKAVTSAIKIHCYQMILSW